MPPSERSTPPRRGIRRPSRRGGDRPRSGGCAGPRAVETRFERRLCRRNPVLGGGSEGGRCPPQSGQPRLAEVFGDHLGEAEIVFDQEDALGHGRLRRGSSAGFAGATRSWGEVRKGGDAPLRAVNPASPRYSETISARRRSSSIRRMRWATGG